jgi:hypothetical protein
MKENIAATMFWSVCMSMQRDLIWYCNGYKLIKSLNMVL